MEVAVTTRAAADVSLTENARKVLEARYLKKDEAGECTETPHDLFSRVAGSIADVEVQYGASEIERQQWAGRFYDLMISGKFMPNSPTLMNAGREMGMLSACFVLPVRDSIVEIFNSIKSTALIQKAGGGTGFAFDELRPTGDFIKSSGGTTSGPISFWRAFSEATNAIQQGAFRRGANMGMMYVHHPDILKFLHAKQDLSQFTNYNISVKITDEWMQQFLADADSPHVVRNPRNGQAYLLPRELDIWKYDVRSLIEIDCVERIDPAGKDRYIRTPRLATDIPDNLRGKVYTKRDIWNIIIKNAWQTGEPGVVFIDRINEANPTPHIGRIEATNPCGEQPLLPYEACNLGSVNLGVFIKHACTPQAEVDWDALRDAVHMSTRFLDNVIDANNYPLDEIDAICKANRKIGLGIMGFADALFRLNVAYNSDEGVAWGERFMKFVNDEAHNYSEHLARHRGCFPNWKGSTWQTQHNRLMRNACTTTVAPTGTISIIANCSGGVEPMFSLAFIRNVLRGQKQGEKPLVEVNDTFRDVAQRRGFLSDALLERIATEGTLAHIEQIPADVKRVFVCAHDITPEWHMRMQAAFQRHCDSSISKTINFPHAASVEDVEQIYRLAFEMRCKGVTVYRDGCRAFQPMALKESEKKQADASAAQPVIASQPPVSNDAPARAVAAAAANVASAPAAAVPPQPARQPASRRPLEPMDLPELLSSFRLRQMTPFGNMHVHITIDPRSQRELEVFAQLGKGGDVANSDLEAICRLTSLWLRSGGSLMLVIKQLSGIGSSLQIPTKAGRIMSLGDGLACALKKYMRAKERFGLRKLLLGEADLAELDQPAPMPSPALMSSPAATSADTDGPTSDRFNSPSAAPGGGALELAAGARPGRSVPNGHSHPPDANGGPHGKPASGEARVATNGGHINRIDAVESGQPDVLRSAAGSVEHPAAPRVMTDRDAAHRATLRRASAGIFSATGDDAASASATAVLESAPPDAGGAFDALDTFDAQQVDTMQIEAAQIDGVQIHAAQIDEIDAAQINAAQIDLVQTDVAGVGLVADVGLDADDALAAFDPFSHAGEAIDVVETQTLVDVYDAPLDAGLDVRVTSVITEQHYANGHASLKRHAHDMAAHYKVKCPECGGVAALQEGCRKCHSCGWSAC